jgi:hypothetical protein
MKPLTTAQTACALLAIFVLWASLSNDDYNTLYVEPIIAQAYHDELHKPREALNRLQEDADTMLALQEVK